MVDRPRSAIVGAGFIGEIHALVVDEAGGVLAAVAGRNAWWSLAAIRLLAGRISSVEEPVSAKDPVWGATKDPIEIGLRIFHRTLRPLLVA